MFSVKSINPWHQPFSNHRRYYIFVFVPCTNVLEKWISVQLSHNNMDKHNQMNQRFVVNIWQNLCKSLWKCAWCNENHYEFCWFLSYGNPFNKPFTNLAFPPYPKIVKLWLIYDRGLENVSHIISYCSQISSALSVKMNSPVLRHNMALDLIILFCQQIWRFISVFLN